MSTQPDAQPVATKAKVTISAEGLKKIDDFVAGLAIDEGVAPDIVKFALGALAGTPQKTHLVIIITILVVLVGIAIATLVKVHSA